MSEFLKEAIFFTYNFLGQNLVLTIFFIGALLKILFLPLDFYNFRFQQKMTKIQPEIKKLQEKYKNDYQKLSTLLFQLYQREKIKPFFSFVNTIFQFIILIALYKALNLIMLDPRFSFVFLGIDLKKPSLILGLIALGLQLFQLKIFKMLTNQSKLMYFFLGLMIVILFTLPSIIIVYWIVNLIFSIVEIFIFKKFFPIEIDKAASSLDQ